MKTYNEFILKEYVEFVKTGDSYKIKHWYNEFKDYVKPFLKEGEWYRIICHNPMEKKELQFDEKSQKYKYKKKAKYLLFVIRFHCTHSDYGRHYIQYDKAYENGKIENKNWKESYIQYDTLKDYEDVIIEHIYSPELKRKKEEMSKLMMVSDPYQEEEWEFENI